MWHRVASTADCPAGSSMEVVAENQVVALYCVEGEYFALDGVCPHQGGPLGEGDLHEEIVTCPWHGWQFDVKTGQSRASQSIHQPCFQVRVDGEDIFVRTDEPAS